MDRQGNNPLTKGTSSLRGASGFTLMEMLITILIMGILAALAAPSFKDFIVAQRLRAAQSDLFNDLIFARSEAVKRNASVLVQRIGANWAGGWTLSVGAVTLRSHSATPTSVTEKTGPASLGFGRDGRQTGATTLTFTFDDSGNKASIAPRVISLDTSGKPRTL